MTAATDTGPFFAAYHAVGDGSHHRWMIAERTADGVRLVGYDPVTMKTKADVQRIVRSMNEDHLAGFRYAQEAQEATADQPMVVTDDDGSRWVHHKATFEVHFFLPEGADPEPTLIDDGHAALWAVFDGEPRWRAILGYLDQPEPGGSVGGPAGEAKDRDIARLVRAVDALRADRVDAIPVHAVRSIDPAEIPRQRAAGWPDFHPENFCHRCGGRNVWSWSADGQAWEQATAHMERGDLAILCPQCFTEAHQAATGEQSTWHIDLAP